MKKLILYLMLATLVLASCTFNGASEDEVADAVAEAVAAAEATFEAEVAAETGGTDADTEDPEVEEVVTAESLIEDKVLEYLGILSDTDATYNGLEDSMELATESYNDYVTNVYTEAGHFAFWRGRTITEYGDIEIVFRTAREGDAFLTLEFEEAGETFQQDISIGVDLVTVELDDDVEDVWLIDSYICQSCDDE